MGGIGVGGLGFSERMGGLGEGKGVFVSFLLIVLLATTSMFFAIAQIGHRFGLAPLGRLPARSSRSIKGARFLSKCDILRHIEHT